MNAINPVKTGKSADDPLATVAHVEGEIRELSRRDSISRSDSISSRSDSSRKSKFEFDDSSLNSSSINSSSSNPNVSFLIEQVAGSSIKEIDSLIAELQIVRDFLQSEGERVQREIAGYAQVSQAAMSSVKAITDTMGQWKHALSAPRPNDR
ncbi:MAG: hypothetical protein J0H17_18970 [Rhizobiales bacterium]|nr:hypothetical protein [Hyphomicrobiales bacterium]